MVLPNSVSGSARASVLSERRVRRQERQIYRQIGDRDNVIPLLNYGGNITADISDKLFGGHDNNDWRAHDPISHADALRGTVIYLSAGTGLPGEYDVPGRADLGDTILFGARSRPAPTPAPANSTTGWRNCAFRPL
ncbi:hypothetical protein [Nocardia alni]|uniref:hypothetical protein n=1 Tax=Nocardia alni TaxID=2815723 RepID=UPI001C212DD7|nr:hypothetical protein [Nocardia alni]